MKSEVKHVVTVEFDAEEAGRLMDYLEDGSPWNCTNGGKEAQALYYLFAEADITQLGEDD